MQAGRVLEMAHPVVQVGACEFMITPKYQQILGVAELGGVGEIEAAGDQDRYFCAGIDHHDLVVGG